MPTEEYEDDRGPESGWVDLTGEENRCLIGLKSYYKTFEDKTDEAAIVRAWIDLQREFERLKEFKWFK